MTVFNPTFSMSVRAGKYERYVFIEKVSVSSFHEMVAVIEK